MARGRGCDARRGSGRADAVQPRGVGHARNTCRRPPLGEMSQSQLTVRAIRATPVEVPMRYVLGTSAAAVRAAPLLLVDVETEEGVTGRTYLFCYLKAAAPAIVFLLGAVEAAVKGERIAPAAAWQSLSKRFRLIGVQGIVRMAMAAFDTACWDALAIAAKQPLAEYLGGNLRAVNAYNSCGLGLMPA